MFGLEIFVPPHNFCHPGPLIDEPSPLKRNNLPKVVKAANMDRIWQVGLVSGHTWLNKMLLLKEEGAKGMNSDTQVQSAHAQHQLYPFVRWDSIHFLAIHYWRCLTIQRQKFNGFKFCDYVYSSKLLRSRRLSIQSWTHTWMKCSCIQVQDGQTWNLSNVLVKVLHFICFMTYTNLYRTMKSFSFKVSYKSPEYG